MKLDVLLASLAPVKVEGSSDREVSAITYDSRRVSAGSMFVALRGEHVDGATFIPRAVAAGAEAIVAENDFVAGGATKIIVPNAREALADLAVCFYKEP